MTFSEVEMKNTLKTLIQNMLSHIFSNSKWNSLISPFLSETLIRMFSIKYDCRYENDKKDNKKAFGFKNGGN